MLPVNIKAQAEYLSEHFDDPVCRRELRRLIEDYINNENSRVLK